VGTHPGWRGWAHVWRAVCADSHTSASRKPGRTHLYLPKWRWVRPGALAFLWMRRALTYPLRRWPRLSKLVLGSAVALVLLVVLANVYVLSKGGDSTSEVSEVPKAEVAIVPGALVEPDGDMSSMLAARVEQASRLWHAGKVEKILVSGDHGNWIYDEPDTMRKALVADGVAPRDVFEDHAGFDTWATMVRAKEIFGVRDAVVVTQGFHMPRALYLADAAGIDATGLDADLQQWGAQGRKSSVREVLSRVKAVADVTLDTPALAGPKIPIATSDGRESWGPAPPEGTPPAGSPG
jgi:SanA protein